MAADRIKMLLSEQYGRYGYLDPGVSTCDIHGHWIMTAGSVVTPLIIPIRLPSHGQSKQEISTSTPVEIKSDTADVSILYTVDGSKPEVLQSAGCRGNNSTLTYSAPIHLPRGKVSVRAMAVTSDGRQSATVTKVFMVKSEVLTESKSRKDDENFMKVSEQEQSRQEASHIGSGGDSTWLQVPRIQGGPPPPPSRSPKGPRFLNSRLGSRAPVEQAAGSTQRSQTLVGSQDSPLRNLTNTQRNRIHRDTDYLRCSRCLNHRPSDPFARFCLHCGFPLAPVPGRSLPPTEGGQMALCVHCNTMVPVNTASCVICEAPIHPQLQPQACLKLQGKVVCPSCGTGNPGHVFSCVTCESRLPQTSTEVFSGHSAPPLPSGESKMVACSKCKRINHCDARFCDWCGSKPAHPARHVLCSRCGASSHPYACYCGTCGVFLEGPGPRSDPRWTTTATTSDPEHNLISHSAIWKPLPSSGPSPSLALAPPTADSGTQTAGLFYPSAAHMHKKEQQGALDTKRQEAMRDRRPLLTAVSPGRGYWRQQVDHVCAHLRSYAQNNPDFRTLIGEPHMGRMVSAVVQEDNFEVSLTINFVSAGQQMKAKVSAGDGSETSSPAKVAQGQTLSSVTEGKNSNTSLDREGSAGQRKAPKQKLVFEPVTKPPLRDRQLLKEVGPDGRGQVSVVQQLLDEGADPSCEDGGGRPALAVAVVNGHHDALPVLVQRGADINQQYGAMNNCALHEAASLGEKGLRCAEVLLGCNASLRRKNRRGLTPYDLAVSSGCPDTVALLAARMGQGLLDTLTRTTAARAGPGPGPDRF